FGSVCDSPVCPRRRCFHAMGQPVDRCSMDRLVRVLAPALIVAGSGAIAGYLPRVLGGDGGDLPVLELDLVGVFVVGVREGGQGDELRGGGGDLDSVLYLTVWRPSLWESFAPR